MWFMKGVCVLDFCCYMVGFLLNVKVIGGVEDVMVVDFDEVVFV